MRRNVDALVLRESVIQRFVGPVESSEFLAAGPVYLRLTVYVVVRIDWYCPLLQSANAWVHMNRYRIGKMRKRVYPTRNMEGQLCKGERRYEY